MDPAYFQLIFSQLVAAFPEHTATLILVHENDVNQNVVATSDGSPKTPAALLWSYIRRSVYHQEELH